MGLCVPMTLPCRDRVCRACQVSTTLLLSISGPSVTSFIGTQGIHCYQILLIILQVPPFIFHSILKARGILTAPSPVIISYPCTKNQKWHFRSASGECSCTSTGCFAWRVEARQTMLNNCRSLTEDKRRWLASPLLGMVKEEKNVAFVTSGQLRRLLVTVWKHPQCLMANSNCILSGMKQVSRSLKTSWGRWKGPVCLLWLPHYFECPTASLLYWLGLLCCERCKDQAVQE